MNNQEITKALAYLRPKAEFVVRGEKLDGIEWLDLKQTKPTDEEIIAAIPLAKAQEIANIKAREIAKNELFAKIGITAEEASLLLSQ